MKKGRGEGNVLGQVSIFIIVALVLVGAIATTVFIAKNNAANAEKNFFSKTDVKPEMNTIKDTILDCIDTSTSESLITIGLQGGFFTKPAKALDLGYTFVPYYYFEGSYHWPGKEVIQAELSKAVNKNLVDCIKKFELSEYKLDYTPPNTLSMIKKGTVNFIIDMPLTISKGEDKVTLEMKRIPFSYNSSLFDILEVASYITNSHKQDPKFLCISCVAELASERKLYVNTFDVPEESVLFVISENTTTSKAYSFVFMNKYNADNEVTQEIAPLPISPATE